MNKSKVLLLAVGDVMVDKHLSTGGIHASFQSILKVFKEGDIIFANLETPLAKSGYPNWPADELKLCFRADPTIAEDLKAIGINIVSVANNHALNYGYEALFETLKTLDCYGIKHVGGGKNLKEATSAAKMTIKGHKIGFLGFSCTLPYCSEATEYRPGIAPIHVTTAYEPRHLMHQPGSKPFIRTSADNNDVLFLQEQIKSLSDYTDIVVVSVHWGVAFQDELAEYQQPLAHAMINAGADLVLGHHPHTIQGIEVYKQKYIMYSLGNFIFHAHVSDKMSPETLLAKVIIQDKNIAEIELLPVIIDQEGFPLLAEPDVGSIILERLRRLSYLLHTSIVIQDNKAIVRG